MPHADEFQKKNGKWWYNRAASRALCEVDPPFYAIPTHAYNLALDSMMVLPGGRRSEEGRDLLSVQQVC